MNKAPEERAGGQDHSPRRQGFAGCRHYACDPACTVEDQILGCGLLDLKASLLVEDFLHRPSIELAVGLGSRSPDRGTLAAVEHPELDAGAVDRAPHDAIERIDLANQVPLGESPDCGIAGHLADGGPPMRKQKCPRAKARRSRRRLAAGMPAANYDDIIGSCHGSDALYGPHTRPSSFT